MRFRALRCCAALLLGGAVLVACGAEEETAVAPSRPVTVTTVTSSTLLDRISATGQLLAKEEAEIAAEVSGRITEILVDEGSAVEQGAVVLAIDPERRALALESAKARREEAAANLKEQRRELRRIAELTERGVASQTQLDQAATAKKLAESRLAAADADLGVAQRALDDAAVKAPFAGLIARRMVGRGEYVNQGEPLFELVALDPIEVEFHVTEVDSGRVRLGQTVEIRVDPYPDQVFHATVSVVSPTIDPRTRTLRVKAVLDNAAGALRPGLFARIDLGVAERSGIAMIPEEAVLQRAEGSVVFRCDDEHRVERILVRTGVHRDGNVEIVSGLAAGDRVVVRGHASLVDGERVAPRQPDGSLVEPIPHVAEARPDPSPDS